MSDMSISIDVGIVDAIDRLAKIVEKGFKEMAMNTADLVAAVDRQTTVVADEIKQAADKIAAAEGATAEDQKIIDEQVARLNQITDSIKTIVPDEAR